MELAAAFFVAFLTVFLGGPYARKYLLSSGIYGIDQQKRDRPKIATSGGTLVLFGFMFSVTFFLGLSKILGVGVDEALVLAALNSATIIALIGLIDDVHIRQEIEIEETPIEKVWDHIVDFDSDENSSIHRRGLGQFTKMFFVLPAVFPLIAVGAGSNTMTLPLIGAINWGILYPLFLLPIGLLFVSNVVNMLAGTNGLAASMSFVASLALGFFALYNARLEAAVIAFCLSGAMLGFLYYNFYPATILPGDSLTYLAGAGLFSTMVIGNMEKFGVFIFIPWIVEFLLKARSRFNAHSWGVLTEHGLEPQHEKNYSLTHPLMRRGFNEKQITLILSFVEAFICLIGLILFIGFL